MEREKSIETKQFSIKGNIMCWEGMMIQLSNVSCVSVTGLNTIPFPWVSLILIVVGFALTQVNVIIGIAAIGIGIAWVIWWSNKNEERKVSKNLNLLLNSGHNFQIIFQDKEFLNKVLSVLEVIIQEGGLGKGSISINVKDCKFGGDAHILNALNLN